MPDKEKITKNDFTNPINEGIFKLLIAANRLDNFEEIKKTLLSSNYHIIHAEDEDEAFELLKKDKFNMLILDMNDKKERNFIFCNKVRNCFSLFELPILIISNNADPQSVVASFESGANDYVSKPFNKKELLARTNTLLTLQLAVENAIFSARNYESEKQQRLFAETLSDLTRSLTSTLNMYDVLKKFLEYLSPFVKFDKSIILIKENEKFKINIATGFNEENDSIEKFAEYVKLEVLSSGIFINNDFVSEKNGIEPKSQAL